jgi:hypothetical protein
MGAAPSDPSFIAMLHPFLFVCCCAAPGMVSCSSLLPCKRVCPKPCGKSPLVGRGCPNTFDACTVLLHPLQLLFQLGLGAPRLRHLKRPLRLRDPPTIMHTKIGSPMLWTGSPVSAALHHRVEVARVHPGHPDRPAGRIAVVVVVVVVPYLTFGFQIQSSERVNHDIP